MSLTELNLWQAVKNQYNYKLQIYRGMFLTMISIQIIFLLLSFLGTSGMSTSSSTVIVSTTFLSGEAVIVMIFIWSFFAGYQLTSDVSRNIDFAFVSNRLSSQLSTIGILATLAAASSLSITLINLLIRVVTYFYVGSAVSGDYNFYLSPTELLTNFIVVFLYTFLLMGFGYCYGMLYQKRKILGYAIPITFFGLLFLELKDGENIRIISNIFNFLAGESSLTVFIGKVMLLIIMLFAGVVYTTNRLEVRK